MHDTASPHLIYLQSKWQTPLQLSQLWLVFVIHISSLREDVRADDG